MLIKTNIGEEFDTNKMGDSKAEIIELVAKSGIREFAKSHGFYCFLVIGANDDHTLMSYTYEKGKDIDGMVRVMDELIKNITGVDCRVAILKKESFDKVKHVVLE